MDELRLRLIERLCRLPEAHLADVQALLDTLTGNPPSISASTVPVVPKYSQNTDKDWPHAPVHRLSEHGTFIVTASTLHQENLFRGDDRLAYLEAKLLRLAKQYEVVLEAWAVFSNHYHFVCHTNGAANQLADFINELHSTTATEVNRRDHTSGRQVWFNFWDTRLTFEKSYFARLNYVHWNAVKHGLVQRAQDYPWCSAAWFERTATKAQIETIYSFKTDRLKIEDDYAPLWSAAV